MNKLYHCLKTIVQIQSMHGFSNKWFKNKLKQVHKITLKIDQKLTKNLLKKLVSRLC